jgi:hypothetical protein
VVRLGKQGAVGDVGSHGCSGHHHHNVGAAYGHIRSDLNSWCAIREGIEEVRSQAPQFGLVCPARMTDEVETALGGQGSTFEKLSSDLTAATSRCSNDGEFHGYFFGSSVCTTA